MLGELRCRLGKISIQDPATSASGGVRNRRQVVDSILKPVLKSAKITTNAIYRVDRGIDGAQCLGCAGGVSDGQS